MFDTTTHAWLIELAPLPNASCLPYYYNGIGWTLDVNEAVRFSRKQDAARIGENLLQPNNLVEHAWTDVTGVHL